MANRKPLVIANGQIQQLQSGDTLDAAVSAGEGSSLTNNESGSITAGQAVYMHAAGAVKKAQANATGTARVVGLVAASSISAAATGIIKTDGVLTLTTTQWDSIAGTSGGLAFGTVYYLDASTAGSITSTAPTTTAQLVVELGTALNTTDLLLSIKRPVLL